MTEVLIKELSTSDINWMTANGRQQQVNRGTVLIRQQSNIDTFYIVLEGTLSATIKRNQESALASAFAALEDDSDLEQEIARFSSGEVLGEMSFLNSSASAITVKAIENSVVLALPQKKLLEKLGRDLEFACRFYHAIAILLLDRFERLIKKFTRRQNLKIPPLQDVPLLFGELNDSDIDWMIQHSLVEEIATNTILIHAGRSVENVYLLLRGTVSVSFTENSNSSLTRLFSILENNSENNSSPGYEIAQITRGEIIGEMALLDIRLPNYTFKARENLQVLTIKRQQLFIKLQQNPAMGSRFYRIVAMLLSARLQGLINRLGYGRSAYRVGQRLAQNSEYSDEIDLDVMDNITLGGARFNWMLQRLKLSY